MILTVSELREHVNTGLGDDALERILDAAEYLIVERAGPAGARTELADGGHRFITTSRPINSAIAITVTEERPLGDATTVVTLTAGDYHVHSGGMLIERLVSGDNARRTWYGRVFVTYTPVDDTALRELVQIELCKSAVNFVPGGVTGEQIGSWSIQYASNALWNNLTERDAILSQLDPEPSMVVVG